jgi:hypothetical protein
MSEKVEDTLDDQCVSDEVMTNMRSSQAAALWRAGMPMDKDCEFFQGLPRAGPLRSSAAWMFGHLVEQVQLLEASWHDAMLIFDIYCLHRPEVADSASLPAVCAAITRLVKKLDDAEPKDYISALPGVASSLAQWLKQSACPQFEARVTQEDLARVEDDILRALGWNIKLPTVQDWMTVLCARLNIFTCNGLNHLLTPVLQNSILHSRVLTTHCTTTTTGAHRLAQGLLCLNLISAQVLPADTFGLTELATGVAAAGQPQCRQESLEFLLGGLEDATGSDISMLKADTHLVNETLLMLRTSS